MKTVTAQSPAIVLCRMSHMVMVSFGLIVRYMAQLRRGAAGTVISESSTERGSFGRDGGTHATPKLAAPSMHAAPIICGPMMYSFCVLPPLFSPKEKTS